MVRVTVLKPPTIYRLSVSQRKLHGGLYMGLHVVSYYNRSQKNQLKNGLAKFLSFNSFLLRVLLELAIDTHPDRLKNK